MTTSKIQKYRAADLRHLMDTVFTNSIGLEDYFQNFNTIEPQNYPPFNIVNVNNIESRLEVALAGFNKDEVKVYTEYGKLTVAGAKPWPAKEETFVHRELANRSFKLTWTIAEDTQVTGVVFENGLLVVELGKIVPDHHARKYYLT